MVTPSLRIIAVRPYAPHGAYPSYWSGLFLGPELAEWGQRRVIPYGRAGLGSGWTWKTCKPDVRIFRYPGSVFGPRRQSGTLRSGHELGQEERG